MEVLQGIVTELGVVAITVVIFVAITLALFRAIAGRG